MTDVPRLTLAKAPVQLRWQIPLKPGGRVVYGLVERSRQDAVELISIPGPPGLEELVHDDLRADLAVALSPTYQGLAIPVRTLSDHQSGFQQGERVDEIGTIQCELQGNAATKGVANHMCLLFPHMAQQRTAVNHLLLDTRGFRSITAPHVASSVVGDEPVPIGEGRLGNERPEDVRDESPVDEEDRLTDSDDLVFQGDVVEVSMDHELSPARRFSFWTGAFPSYAHAPFMSIALGESRQYHDSPGIGVAPLLGQTLRPVRAHDPHTQP